MRQGELVQQNFLETTDNDTHVFTFYQIIFILRLISVLENEKHTVTIRQELDYKYKGIRYNKIKDKIIS